MHEYKTARSIFGFIEFCAWSVVVIGVIATSAGMAGGSLLGSGGGIWGALPGLAVLFIGLVSVMMVQIGRATIDTAQMTGKLLENSTESLRILQMQSAPASPATATNAAAAKPAQASAVHDRSRSSVPDPKPKQIAQPIPAPAKPAPPPEPPQPKAIEHLGKRIDPFENGWKVGGIHFETVDQAKAFIDETALVARR